MAENAFDLEHSRRRRRRKAKERSFICVICLRLGDKRKLNFHPQFFKAVSRLLHLQTAIAFEETFNNNQNNHHQKWPLCEDCFNLAQRALNLYKEIEVLKLRLNWKLGQIRDAAEISGRIPSRYRRFREQFGGNKKEKEAVKIFRDEYLQKCKLRLKKANPRIKVEKVDINTRPNLENAIDWNQDELVIKTEIHDYDDYGKSLNKDDDDEPAISTSKLEMKTDASNFQIDDPDFCPSPNQDPDDDDDDNDFSPDVNYEYEEPEPEIELQNSKPQPKARTCTDPKEKSKQSRFECTECGKDFASSKSLGNHRKMKHERHKWRFICPEEGCGKRCYDQQKLNNHRLVHSKEKKYLCDTCGRRFRYPDSLRSHVKSGQCQGLGQNQDAKKSFTCDTCGEKFSHTLTLRAHMKNAHSGPITVRKKRIRKVKPKTFVCDICGHAFSWDCLLQLHKKNTHGGPSNWDFTCPVENCGKKCATREKLNVHIRTHSNERPFFCDFCGISYRQRQSLKLHVQNMHGKPAEVNKVQAEINKSTDNLIVEMAENTSDP